MENLHLLYNKTIYDKLGMYLHLKNPDRYVLPQDDRNNKGALEVYSPDLDPQKDKFKFSRIIQAKFDPEKDYTPLDIASQTFCLQTTYPGLLAGSGYAHGISNDNDSKIGFSFDYVTGQPVIPGSSIKGTVKSAFLHPEIIRFILSDKQLSDKEIGELETDIFENNDVFFDAVISDRTNGMIIGEDYITHHEKPTKNPVPIKFIKILPNVVFEFRFRLTDTKLESGKTVTAEEKKNLFKEIISTLGIGAKTNVGYGNMVAVSE